MGLLTLLTYVSTCVCLLTGLIRFFLYFRANTIFSPQLSKLACLISLFSLPPVDFFAIRSVVVAGESTFTILRLAEQHLSFSYSCWKSIRKKAFSNNFPVIFVFLFRHYHHIIKATRTYTQGWTLLLYGESIKSEAIHRIVSVQYSQCQREKEKNL